MCIDSQNLPFPDSFFDAIVCVEVIEHLFDPIHALAEMNRGLKPNGILILSTPNIGFIACRITLLLGHFSDLASSGLPSPHIRFYTYNMLKKCFILLDLRL